MANDKCKYLSKVTDKELQEFLINNGYELVDLLDTDGKKIPSIERSEYDIFVRCRNTEDNETFKMVKANMLKRNPFLHTFMSKSNYDMVDCLNIRDFNIFRISALDYDKKQDTLFTNYIMFMYDKFGEDYIYDFNHNLEKNSKEK